MNESKIAKFLLGGGALALALGGMITAACSSGGGDSPGAGSSSGGTATGSSSGAASGSSSGTAAGSSSGSAGGSSSGAASGSSSGGTSDDAGTACKIPSLHPNAAGDVYCGFSDAGDLDCLADSGAPTCCLGGKVGSAYAPQVCGALGASCTNGTGAIPIECGQPSDCTAHGMSGAACCLQGATSGPVAVTGCAASDLKQSGGTAIACEMGDAGAAESDGGAEGGAASAVSSCASGEHQVCAQQSDCPTGTTCTPVHWKLYDLGFCM